MAKLTDQLKKRGVRSLVRNDMPEWWPAAQIACAVALGVALVVMSISHFGRHDALPSATSGPVQTGPVITAAPALGLGTLPVVSTTAPTQPQDSVPRTQKGMPMAVDASTVAVLQSDGTTKALPLAAWLAAKDKLSATYPRSTPTAVWVLASTGASNTFSVELSNPEQDSIVVQITAVLKDSGIWAAG